MFVWGNTLGKCSPIKQKTWVHKARCLGDVGCVPNSFSCPLLPVFGVAQCNFGMSIWNVVLPSVVALADPVHCLMDAVGKALGVTQDPAKSIRNEMLTLSYLVSFSRPFHALFTPFSRPFHAARCRAGAMTRTQGNPVH